MGPVGEESVTTRVVGQPSIIVNEGIHRLAEMVDTLGHEMTHAADYLDYPVWMLDRDGAIEQRDLSYELRAYAIGNRIGKIALDWSHRIVRRRWGGLLPSIGDSLSMSSTVAEVVESIRQRVNGDFLSPNAFDPNDKIIKALDDAGLRGIYSRDSH